MPSSSSLHTVDAEADDSGDYERAPSLAKIMVDNAQGAQTASIPVSAYAPVPLARPMSVFGAKFVVHLSEASTLSPDTVLRAVMDLSLHTFLRTENPALLNTLRKLLYAGKGKHRPTRTTKKGILQCLEMLDPEAVAAILDGREPAAQPHESDWRHVLRGLGEGKSNFVGDIANDLSVWDDQALQLRELIRAGKKDQAHALVGALLGPKILAWEALNRRLLQVPQVLLLVESSLQTLARLMLKVDTPLLDLPSRESKISELLDAGGRPLGHWLHDVQLASDCKSLSDLANRLLRVGACHHDRPVTHDLLKKWSSSKRVAMPQAAVKVVLRGVRIREHAERLHDRYYVARFLTFLCDLTRAGLPGEAPAWSDIQAQIKKRYSQVFQLEAANWPAPLATS